MSDGYCVFQAGYHIFGTGLTRDEAIANSKEWLDPHGETPIQTGRGSPTIGGKLYVTTATARLIQRVDQLGGTLAYDYNGDGHLDLIDG